MNEQDNKPLDEIEARLQAMTPAEPNAAIRQRIAASIGAADPPIGSLPPWRRRTVLLAVAAVIALAGVAVVVVSRDTDGPMRASRIDRPDRRTHGNPPADDRSTAPSPPTPAGQDQPTLLALHAALRDSSDALTALVDRGAQRDRTGMSMAPGNPLTAADARRWVQQENLQ